MILQAGAMGESGEIYILKMGQPVKILDMAKDLIRLSGFEPDKDIRIEITGLRPGEKLYEELITEGEGIVPTRHDKLMVLKGNGGNGLSYNDLERKIEELLILADRNNAEGIKAKLKEIVPEYNPKINRDSAPIFKWIEELLSLVDRKDNGGIKAILKEILAEYKLIQPLSEDERNWFEELLLATDKNDNDKIKTMLQDADKIMAGADKHYWSPQVENRGSRHIARRWV